LSRSTLAERGLLALLAALVAIFAWRSLSWPLVHDAPILHYIAWRIAHGAAPYRDLFDMNFPGAYLIDLGVVRLFGAGDAGWRAFDLLWLAGGVVCIAATVATWGRVAAACAGLFFALYHLAGGAWQAGQRDFVVSPLLVLAALGVARWAEGRDARSDLVWSALALGAAVTVKPHAIVFAAALCVAIGVVAARSRRSPWRSLGTFAASLLVIPALVVGWVAVRGGLSAWQHIVFDYLLPLYSRLGRPASWAFTGWRVWLAILPAAALALATAFARRRFTIRHALVAVGLAYGVMHFFGQGKGWEYHLYPLAAFASTAMFAGLSDSGNGRRTLAWAAVFICILAATVLLVVRCVREPDAPWVAVTERRVTTLTHELAGRISSGDRVQVLDTTDGGIHALLRLGVLEPTRFLYDFHFYHDVDSPIVRTLRAEFVRDLDARPPRCIVLLEHGWPTGGFERVRGFPELEQRLERYPTVSRGDGYVLYAR
jgi:hypothetical protein